MIIYDDKISRVDLNLSVVPGIFTLFNNEQEYKFTLTCDDLNGNCPTSILNKFLKWRENNKQQIRNIIFEWNTGKNTATLIEDKLVI